MYTARNYIKAESLAQAYELNQRRANAILGGGCWMRMGERMYDTLIDLSGLELDQIQDRGEEAALGAMVTLRRQILCWTCVFMDCSGSVPSTL